MTFSYTRAHYRYRAAGQAIAALVVGADLLAVDEAGVSVRWPRRLPGDRRPDAELCAEMLVRLGGLTALDRYGFGVLEEKPLILPPGPNMPLALSDYVEADVISADLTVEGFQLWRATWSYAAALMAQPDVWAAVEAIALRLKNHPLGGRETAAIAAASGRPL